MIYPHEIEKWVVEQKPLDGFLQPYVFQHETNKSRRVPRSGDFWMEVWLATEGRRNLPEVRRYLDYLAEMRTRFVHIQKEMMYENRDATHQLGHDQCTAGWAGDSMMPIAAYLYYLHSRGLKGSVLECGVFKGGSTCCLSWICKSLGFGLYAADSFEGLPSSEGHYGRGDFKGGYEEVRSNLKRLGSGMTTNLIKGFYADSLKGFNEPLVAIWLDVDLKQSVLDALGHTYSQLLPNGVIFSDGLVDDVDFEQERIKGECGEPGGFVEFFASRGIPYKAKPGGPRGLGLIVPQCADDENLLYEHDKLVELFKLAELPGLYLTDRDKQLETILQSNSWKITSPLRQARRIMEKLWTHTNPRA